MVRQMRNLEQDSLTLRVYRELRREIVDGRLAPGSALVEAKLSKELGVSRTPVREALRLLEQDGLVDTIPNKCSIVVAIDRQDILDTYEIRKPIFGLCVRWACERMTDEEVEKLENALELQEFYCTKNEFDKVCELDTEFHDILYAGAKSRTVTQTLHTLHIQSQRAREIAFRDDARTLQAVREHRAILEAIRNRDAAAAEIAAIEHLNQAKKHVLKGLK